MLKKKLCLLPGLAFDYRIFQNLVLGQHEIQHLGWIEPLHKEKLKDYAARVSGHISTSSHPPVLIGHSFGGVLVQEIASMMEIEKVIIISSIKSQRENTLNFKAIASLGLHHLANKSLTFLTFPYWGKNHGYETSTEQALFKDMVRRHSDHYLKWSLNALSSWQGVENLKPPIIHIHGDQDKTFPINLIEKPVLTIKGGGHFMVYKQPDIVSRLILNNL